jgi:hypothetical protein
MSHIPHHGPQNIKPNHRFLTHLLDDGTPQKKAVLPLLPIERQQYRLGKWKGFWIDVKP